MENCQGRWNAQWALCFTRQLVIAILFVSCSIGVVQVGGLQHQVGGTPGWSLPSRAGVNYTVWASSQTFKVGDTLYFNYSSAYHNVLEVSEAAYASCNASNTISEWTDGADFIPLNSSGTFYYICGIPGHCEAGQKVAVKVMAAETGKQHQVGGPPGWSLPSRANVNYTVWASTQNFLVGDTLYFNYSSAYHNVLEVTAAKYDKCDASNPMVMWDDGATVIPLNTTGTFYYICGIPGHCDAGQKVAVTVTKSESASETAGPGRSPAPAPAASDAALPGYKHPVSRLSGLIALALVLLLKCSDL